MTEVQLTQDEQIEEYISVAFSNGFSRGTANVTPQDMKKLRPLLQYYAKKPHPFTACVRDNRKRFGPRTAAVCAVVKDLIYHSTKWRGQGKGKANMSADELHEYVIHSPLPDEFFEWLSEMDEARMLEFAALTQGGANLDVGGPVTQPANETLENYSGQAGSKNEEGDFSNAPPPGADYHLAENPNKASCGICKWFEDGVCANWAARVDPHYVSNAFEYDAQKGGAVGLEDTKLMAEMFFTGEAQAEDAGLIWKTILREGTWKYSPGDGQAPKKKPITVTKDGSSDPAKMVISMGELLSNFQDGAVEHVQIPTRHAAGVLENTGFTRNLRIVQDTSGKWVLQAGLDFTEPEVKGKAERGTIANTSAGVLFNFVRKEDGKKYGAVLDHVALTNRPWLNGLQPFGAQLGEGEEVEVVAFSADDQEVAGDPEAGNERHEGGEHVPDKDETTQETVSFEQTFGLSEAGIRSRLEEYDRLKESTRRSAIKEKVRGWEEEKKTPAVIKLAEELMLADEGQVALNLSEDGSKVGLTATEIVERLVKASPTVDLATDKVTDEGASEGQKPDEDATKENETAKLSHEERALASELFLSGEAKTEEDAVQLAQKRLAAKEDKGK